MLRTFNKVPKLNTTVVLIVGAPGVGKHTLAKALLCVSSSVSLEVRTVLSLPLPEDATDSRPRIDFVIFVVDQTNRESFLVAKRSMPHIDVSFRLGKICLVLTQVNNAICRSVSFDAMGQLADSYQCQMLCCDMQNADERSCLAQQLINKIRLSNGLQNGVSSLLVDCTRVLASTDDVTENENPMLCDS